MRWAMLLVLGVVGCGPQPMPCSPGGAGGFGAAGPEPLPGTGGGFGGGTGAGATQPGVAGKPFTVALSITQNGTSCAVPRVDDVVTEVLDPSNRKVDHAHTAAKAASVNLNGFGQAGFTTEVTFTPPTPGTYHLTARFEPSLGSAQRDVEVAVDRTGAPSKTLSLGVSCSALEVLPSGLVVCLSGEKLLLFRDELSLAQAFDADDFAVAGGQVWTTRFGVVRRHTDLGGAAPLGNTLTFDTQLSDLGTLIAHENDVAFFTSSSAVKLKVEGGALKEEARIYPLSAASWAVHPTANADQLLLATSFGTLCVVTLKSGFPMNCAPHSGDVLGADQSGLWINTGAALQHVAWEGGPDAGSLSRASLSFPGLQAPADLGRHFEGTPVLVVDGKNFVPRWGPDGIALEGYDLPAGYTLLPGSTKTVRAQNAAGMQRLFTR